MTILLTGPHPRHSPEQTLGPPTRDTRQTHAVCVYWGGGGGGEGHKTREDISGGGERSEEEGIS